MGLLDRVRQAAPTARGSEASCWVPAGETVEVAGRRISGGLFYLGSDLPPIAEAYWLEVEPALIDPSLAVAAQAPRQPVDDFVLSYATLPPGDRAAYLDWLAGERRIAEAGPFFNLYFCGLERRLIVGQRFAADPDAEWRTILSELGRLRAEASEEQYAHEYTISRFIAFLEGLAISHGAIALEPPRERTDWETPLAVRLQFGRLAEAAEPLPAEWALSWVLTSTESYLRTPAERCPEEFEQLFEVRYRERFGEGLQLPTGGPKVSLRYQTTNHGLPTISQETDLPDAADATQAVEALRGLALECCSELDAYSRWLGRNPDDRGSFKAAALLPAPLLEHADSPQLTAFRALLASASAGEPPWAIDPAEMIELWSPGEPKLSKKEATVLAQLLGRLGFGIEPDPRFGGPSPTAGSPAVLFEAGEEDPKSPSPAFESATLLLHLLAAVAAGDGSISAEEEEHLERHMAEVVDLYPGERERMRAHTQWLTRSKPKFAGLRKKLEPLGDEQRRTIAHNVVAIAAADGEVPPEEVKVLTKIFELLGLDPESVYSEVHAITVGESDDEPVVVRDAGEAAARHAIPAEKKGLNRATVEERIEETALVSSLLAEIFDDRDAEDDPAAATPDREQEPAEPDCAGLSQAHRDLARELAKQETWSRLELESLASRLGLLVDGALEAVNDAAFEACDAPLTEGEDPIEIDTEVAKEMLR